MKIDPTHAASGFSPVLSTAGSAEFSSALGRVTAQRPEDQIRQAAEQLIATSLVQPILASMSQSPFREGVFAPGPIEERFTPLLHRHLSDRIVASANFGLVEALTDHLVPRERVEMTA